MPNSTLRACTTWARAFRSTRQLRQEKIGEKTTVHDLFDRWVLNESVRAGRGKHYAEVTKDCKGKIELDFSLTPTQWQNSARRKRYYRSIGRLVIKVGRQLLADFGNQLSGTEKTFYASAACTRLAGIPLATLYSLQELVLRGVKRWFVQRARRLGYCPSRTLPPLSRRASQRTLLRVERVLLDREHALLRLHGIFISSTWTRAASHVTTVSWTSCSARTISTRRGSATVTTNFLKTKSTAPTRPERLPDSATTTRIVRG